MTLNKLAQYAAVYDCDVIIIKGKGFVYCGDILINVFILI